MKQCIKVLAACLAMLSAIGGTAKALTTNTIELVSSSYSWSMGGAQSGILNTTFSQTTGQLSTGLNWAANPQTYAGGGIEQWISFATPVNWSGYQTLSLRYKLTSNNATITSDGYPVELTIYDGGGIHEIVGSSGDPGQNKYIQLIADGAWHTYVLDLRSYHRAAVNSFTMWFSNPYTFTSNNTLLISNATVTGQTPLFDGKGMSSNLAAPSTKTVAHTLSTSDNLNLQMTSQGALVGVTKGTGTPVAWGNNAQPGGFLVRDNSATTAPTQLLGTVSTITGGYAVTANSTALHLNTTANYTASGNMIHVALSATNTTTSTNRYLTYYLALPVKTSSTTWKWSTDLLTNTTVGTASNIEDLTYRYPITTLCGTSGANTVGLSLAVPLNEPQNFRLAYNESTGILYAAFDIALTNVTKSSGGTFNTATADVYLYACDPAWGIRSALQSYYTTFSTWFTKRIIDGGWNVWGDGGDASLAYMWGGPPSDYAGNHANGGLNFAYIFPQYLDLGVNDLATPSRSAITTRLSNLAAGNAAELGAVEALPYANAIYDIPDIYGANAYWTAIGKASAASGWHDSSGHLVTGLGWQGSYGAVATLPANLVMAVPNGAGALQWQFMQDMAAYYETLSGGATVDGWAFDGTWPDYTHDYNSADFPYMPFPLSFERDVTPLAVSVPARLAFASWLGSVNAADPSKTMFINATPSAATPVTFMAPYVDIFGNEEGAVGDPAYNRQLAYRRNVCYLPYTAQPDDQVYYHLLYDIHPGVGLAGYQFTAMDAVLPLLDAAGWQPITYATPSVAGIRVERYGSSSPYYLVCYNTTGSSASFNLTVNTTGMGFTPNRATAIFGTDQMAVSSSGVFPLTLASGKVCVLKVEANSTVWTTAVIGTSGDNDILVPTGGQTLMAAQAYSSSLSNGVAVNGVTFTAVHVSGTTFSSGNVSGVASLGGNNSASTGTYIYSSPPKAIPVFTALSANYQSLLTGSLVGSGSSPDGSGNYTLGTDTITLSGLTSGKTYIARFWANCNYGSGSVDVTMGFGPVGSTTIASGLQGDGNNNLNGTMFTAVFTATAATQTFVYETNYQPQINAVEVIQQN
jgi:hypothetical protein